MQLAYRISYFYISERGKNAAAGLGLSEKSYLQAVYCFYSDS